jgi:hypothetical protein
LPNVDRNVERQIESIRRVLRERGARQRPRRDRVIAAPAAGRDGSAGRGPLTRAIASVIAHGIP